MYVRMCVRTSYHQLLYRECLSQHICVRVYLGVGKHSVEAKRSRPAKTQRFVKALDRDAENEHEEDTSIGGDTDASDAMHTFTHILLYAGLQSSALFSGAKTWCRSVCV